MHAQMARRLGVAAVTSAITITLAACGSSNGTAAGGDTPTGGATPTGATTGTPTSDWSTAQSAAAGGGMKALVAAANAEGKLNVIALSPTWANYGEILKAFQKTYPKVHVVSENPGGGSQQELDAVEKNKGQATAPDVVDVGTAFAARGALAGDFAAYKVATWDDIPAAQKDAGGLWWADYGGYIAIGCNPKAISVPCPKTIKALDNPALKGKVALNGDPTQANAALMAVYAAAVANGSTAAQDAAEPSPSPAKLAGEIQPGIDFFKKLNDEGVFNKTSVTPATVATGATPIVLDWDYLQVANAQALKSKGLTWQVNDPSDGLVGAFYNQAINATAPHPAAARLWEEFLMSHAATGGQNGYLRGFAHPAELDAMKADHTLDAKAAAMLPPVDAAKAVVPTVAQVGPANETIVKNWPAAVN